MAYGFNSDNYARVQIGPLLIKKDTKENITLNGDWIELVTINATDMDDDENYNILTGGLYYFKMNIEMTPIVTSDGGKYILMNSSLDSDDDSDSRVIRYLTTSDNGSLVKFETMNNFFDISDSQIKSDTSLVCKIKEQDGLNGTINKLEWELWRL